MFGPSYFGVSYFGPVYFGSGGEEVGVPIRKNKGGYYYPCRSKKDCAKKDLAKVIQILRLTGVI